MTVLLILAVISLLYGCVTTADKIVSTSCPPEDAILLFDLPGIGTVPGGIPKGALDNPDHFFTQEEWDRLGEGPRGTDI